MDLENKNFIEGLDYKTQEISLNVEQIQTKIGEKKCENIREFRKYKVWLTEFLKKITEKTEGKKLF